MKQKYMSLESSPFFYDPTDVGDFISGSSAFSKSSLKIWKFSVHMLLKPTLENSTQSKHDWVFPLLDVI